MVRRMSTVTPPRERERTGGPGGGIGDACRVIVLNDDHNTFDGVAFALARTLPGVTFERGMDFATMIHTTGQAIVWTGRRELAEHYWQQLSDFGLTMAPLSSSG